MIKNIVFDIGRVLLDYQPMQFLNSLGFNEEDSLLLDKIIFKHNLWQQMDRGIVTKEEAIAAYCKEEPSHAEDIRLVMNTWHEMLTPIEGTTELLRALIAKGYDVYLLSNFQKEGFEEIYNKFSFLGEVKGKVISYEAKLLKPEREIYISLLEKYSLMPQETVFIDDLRENIEAAIAVGIHGIVFESAVKTRAYLQSVGVDA